MFQILMSVYQILSNVTSMRIVSTHPAVMNADVMTVLRELGKFVAVSLQKVAIIAIQ